jgi:hypothetical protein
MPWYLSQYLDKNGKAVGVENIVLGRRIIELVKKLGGQPAKEDYASLWAQDLSDDAMARLGIPKTSEQYQIDVTILPDIHRTLSEW